MLNCNQSTQADFTVYFQVVKICVFVNVLFLYVEQSAMFWGDFLKHFQHFMMDCKRKQCSK